MSGISEGIELESADVQAALSSISKIDIVEHVFRRQNNFIVPRPVDVRWQYSGVINKNLGGFNPFTRRSYVPFNSFSSLLKQHYASRQDYEIDPCEINGLTNYIHLLRYDVLYAVHDYIHCAAIDLASSRFGFMFDDKCDSSLISNLELCLFLSEVCAVVGLDYWLLCKRFAITGDVSLKPLTTDFGVDRASWEKFSEIVLDRSFFYRILSLYGYRVDIESNNSPFEGCAWFERELSQALMLRKLARRWMTSCFTLPGDSLRKIDIDKKSLSATQLELVDCVCNFAIDVFLNLNFDRLAVIDARNLGAERISPAFIDPRFVNLSSHLDRYEILGILRNPTLTQRQFGYVVLQYVSQHRFAYCKEMSSGKFDEIIINRDIDALSEWSKKQSVISKGDVGPTSLVFQN